MSIIEKKYKQKCNDSSDINEHLPTLKEYALQCNHITEAGVRSGVSSYAFASGLLGKSQTMLIQIDLNYHPNITELRNDCAKEGIHTIFYEQSDLECPLETTDLFFIDTWHIYGHLKRELARWNSYVTKYIIMHDTTVDVIYGETIRNGWNAVEQSQQSGIPIDEINKGLWPAVEEFLASHPEWVIDKRYTNNNGLTILKRV